MSSYLQRPFFPEKVTFTASGGTYLLGAIVQPTADTSVSDSTFEKGSVSKIQFPWKILFNKHLAFI